MIKVLKNNYELILLTLVAFAIRLINLGKLNLWLDEGVTAGSIHQGLSFIIRDSFTAEPTPPLYNILMYYWGQVFGDSEFCLRFPSAIFGALSISLVYLIGKKYVSKEVGILSATLIIGNPFYLYYSQEARAYALFSFLALASIYYFPISNEWKDKKKYFLATLLVPWVHAYGVFLILAQNVYVLIKFYKGNLGNEKKIFLKIWIKYQAIIILVASSWYIFFLLNTKRYLNRFKWIKPITPNDFFELFKSFIGSGEMVVEFLLIISLLLALFVKRKEKKDHHLLLLFLWPFLSIALPIFIGHLWHPFFMGRYSIAASMVIVILILTPMDLFLKKSKKIFFSLILLAAIFNVYQTINYFKTVGKDQWTKAVQMMLANDQQKSIVVLEHYQEGSSLDYYLRKMDLKNRIRPYYLKDFNQMKFLIKGNDHIWFIYFGQKYPEGFNSDHYFIEEKFNQSHEYLQLVKLRTRTNGVL